MNDRLGKVQICNTTDEPNPLFHRMAATLGFC